MHRECQTITKSRIESARGDLTDRMAALEQRVVGAVNASTERLSGAAAAIGSTVTGAASQVQDVVGATADGVRTALDVREHIRSRPWAGIGAAAVTGFLAGFLPKRSKHAQAFVSEGPGVVGELWTVLRKQLVSLGETAIVAATEAAKQGVKSHVSMSTASNGAHYVNGKC
jgi:ElaB/YqjD/DUF883 family membrane-anchored ribosome-binding protein